MKPRILTPFADRNIYVEPDFSGVCKILPRNNEAVLEIMVKSFRLYFLPPNSSTK